MMGSSVDFQRYRPCVGALVLNQANAIFTALRIDNPGNYWQMPQGGIEPDETPEQALRRELYEENAMVSVSILAENPEWLSYDLPPELREKLWNGRWVGQAQKWFALRFTGARERNQSANRPARIQSLEMDPTRPRRPRNCFRSKKTSTNKS